MKLFVKISLLVPFWFAFGCGVNQEHASSDVEMNSSIISAVDTIPLQDGKFYLQRYDACNRMDLLHVYLKLSASGIDSSKYLFVKVYNLDKNTEGGQISAEALTECYNNVPMKAYVSRRIAVDKNRVYVFEHNSSLLENRMGDLVEEVLASW